MGFHRSLQFVLAATVVFAAEVSTGANLGAFAREIALDVRTLALDPKHPPQFWRISPKHAFDGENALMASVSKDGREVALAHSRINPKDSSVAQTLFEAPPLGNGSTNVSIFMKGPNSLGLVREIQTGQGNAKLTQVFRVAKRFDRSARVQEVEQIEARLFDGTAKLANTSRNLEGHVTYRENGAIKVYKFDEFFPSDIGSILRFKFNHDGSHISVFAVEGDQVTELIYKIQLSPGKKGEAGLARFEKRGSVKLTEREIADQAFFKIEHMTLAGRQEAVGKPARGVSINDVPGAQ